MGPEHRRPRRSDAAPVNAFPGQPDIGVVSPQRQPELGARGEHAVGLADAMKGQIVDQHAKIGFGARQPDLFPAARQPRRVDAGEDALGRGFLVTGGAIDLAREEQAGQGAEAEAGGEGDRIDVVVFHRVPWPDHPRVFQAGNGPQQRLLDRFRQRGGDAIRVDGGVVQALRFQKNVVPVALGEALHLVLDGWTIARPDAADIARVNGGPVQVLPDDRVRRGRGGRDPAGQLRRGDAARHGRKRFRRRIAWVGGQAQPVDGAAVEPGRGTGLQAAHRQVQPLQGQRETDRRALAHPSGGCLLVANVNNPAQECAGRQHRRAAGDPGAIGAYHRRQPPVRAEFQIFHGRRAQSQSRRRIQRRPHRPSIQ